jgi:hypothetical protein
MHRQRWREPRIHPLRPLAAISMMRPFQQINLTEWKLSTSSRRSRASTRTSVVIISIPGTVRRPKERNRSHYISFSILPVDVLWLSRSKRCHEGGSPKRRAQHCLKIEDWNGNSPAVCLGWEESSGYQPTLFKSYCVRTASQKSSALLRRGVHRFMMDQPGSHSFGHVSNI